MRMKTIEDDEIYEMLAESVDDGVRKVKKILPEERVVKLCVNDRIYWLKQSERHSNLKKRLRKGDGVEALKRERQNLISLEKRSIPVPQVLSFSNEYLVISDCGITLSDLLKSPTYSSSEGAKAFFEAGRALGQLHSDGIALGRGKAKDFCWDGEKIYFIDFEESPKEFCAAKYGRKNLYNFVYYMYFSAFNHKRDVNIEVRAFLSGYTSIKDTNIIQTIKAIRSWAKRRWWLAAISLPIAFLKPLGRSPDFKAIAPTLILFSYFTPE